MNITLKTFDELSNAELYELLKLRSEIFVVEQNCVYLDLDDFDQEALHLFIKENTHIIAYVRLLQPGSRFKEASIGRVVTKSAFRNKGVSRSLMLAAIEHIEKKWELPVIKLSAQSYLCSFYESLGFKIVTEEYLEDGIPHFGMKRIVQHAR
ncbi:MAG: GNAT family N-acetyltransferase [Prolixibacteraceae bacterium]